MGLLRSMTNKVLLILVGIISLQCNYPEEKIIHQTERGRALGTTYTIIYEVPEDTVRYRDEIEAVFEKVNASMSTYIPDSDISRINKGDTTVVTDAAFREVFQTSKEVWKKTDGVFDPTVGALVNAWGFGPEMAIEDLDSARVDSILVYTGMNKVYINKAGNVIKDHPELYLDFNALAKGYCVDLVGRVLEEKGVKNYLVEIGGELIARGRNTIKNKDWVVAIDDPFQRADQRELISSIMLKDRAMATSGNYRKYRVDDKTGERYVHTIDPRSGFPFKNSVLSVSVLAPTCMLADAYATAFMGMPFETILKTLKELPDLDVYIISFTEEGGLQEYRSPGFERLMITD